MTPLAQVALAHDFDPVRWDEAPDWRRIAMVAVARAALGASGLSRADHARSAWFLSMTLQGWRWGRMLDERERTHPGVVEGDLTSGGTRHWTTLVDAVRDAARAAGVRMTE